MICQGASTLPRHTPDTALDTPRHSDIVSTDTALDTVSTLLRHCSTLRHSDKPGLKATQVACKKLKVGKGPHFTQSALRFGKTNKQPPASSGAGTSTADAIQAW